MTGELAAIMAEITDNGQRFGHRQHIQLAFIAGRRHGTAAAADLMREWITQIAAAHGAPHKYHETMTVAWARLVAHHVAADPAVTGFDEFADRYPALLDKTLLSRHYTPGVLGSAAARTAWVEPDLRPFPAGGPGWLP
jgi:hypothetical protein